MRKRKKTTVIIVLCSIFVLIFVPVLTGYLIFRPQIKAAASVKKLEEHLYTLRYEGDYGFDAFIEQGGASTDADMANYIISFLTHGLWKDSGMKEEEKNIGCSTLSVTSPDGGTLFGRNYDWENCDAMIVETTPKNGYASVSTCCLNFLGFGDDWKPEGVGNQMMALAAVYVPLDGMNEKGLCIADLMAGDKTETHQNTDKGDLTTVSAIRLILDHAATVDEAVALLNKYDMNSSIGSAHHFAISDASGKSVVVEYIDNEMHVTTTPIVTNHYLAEGKMQGTGSEQSHIRFDTLDELNAANATMTVDDVRTAMSKVAQSNYINEDDEHTQWTLVCDTKSLALNFYFKEQYNKPYTYHL